MSFLSDLRRELAARGIRGRLADRIVAEFADHLACDPDANLGTPEEIAERFAAELPVARTRRSRRWRCPAPCSPWRCSRFRGPGGTSPPTPAAPPPRCRRWA